MADFLVAVEKTLVHEGGLEDDPSDPGGLTKWGISSRAHPGLDVRSLTRDQAIEIYRKQYWNPRYDQIVDQRLANSLFDFGVTSHPTVAVKTLQHVLTRHRLASGELAIDGDFGPQTLQATNASIEANADLTLRFFSAHRLLFYASLPMPEYYESWFERALDY